MRIIFLIIVMHGLCAQNFLAQKKISTQVLIVGGGTSGVAAAIQAARQGVNVIVVEPTVWLGGMISAAGVTATDGNHKLPSGIWREFREKIYKVYGGPQKVETGWVSNTHFEPRVADSIWKKMINEYSNIKVEYGWWFKKVLIKRNKVLGAEFYNNNNQTLKINAEITIDATEYGDVMASAKIPFNVGMESQDITGENCGVLKSNNIIQDLTYVAILKDYGKGADKTIPKPDNFNPKEFDGACTDYYIDTLQKKPNVNAEKMLSYGKLPNNKYMLNWPNKGNDTYLDIINLSNEQRIKELEKAKQTTLRYIYFIQTVLGYKNLGLADDEFPTADKLALMPYIRESRRLVGKIRFTANDIAEPFINNKSYYRTGIAVGDYPIDHHHKKNLEAPQHLEFFAVPSYNVPIGTLIPQKAKGIVVAEKSISVSNVANGTTRLQPVVIQIGQAAGSIAAFCVQNKINPQQIDIRSVQKKLLENGVYLMPYIDVNHDHPFFNVVQRIGATGILKGKGIPYKWANQTWFYPDSLITSKQFASDIEPVFNTKYLGKSNFVNLEELLSYCKKINTNLTLDKIQNEWKFDKLIDVKQPLTRLQIAYIIDTYLNPFDKYKIDFEGKIL